MDPQLKPPDQRGLSELFPGDSFRSMREEFDTMMREMTKDWKNHFHLGKSFRLPSLNLSETEQQLELTMEVPGVPADEIEIELSGRTLNISGEHQEESEETRKRFHRMERQSGSFHRIIDLPCEVQEDQISAQCQDGVLTVTLPKSEQAVTRKIEVKQA